jgi:hypothetical protein
MTASKTMSRHEAVEELYRCVQTRPRPEDVAELVLDVLDGQLTDLERRILGKAAKHSLKQNAWGYSSMATDFVRPVGAERQVRVAEELFAVPAPLSAADCLHADRVEAFLRTISTQIDYVLGHSNFKFDRLNRAARAAASLGLTRRQYNKRWRLLVRLEGKITRMVAGQRTYELTRYSKSALAIRLGREDLARDLPTACFVAYLSSRMSKRSIFTNRSQERAFDQVADALYRKAKGSGEANWWAMAHVHPEAEVLAHLTEEEKGKLLATWFRILEDLATRLEHLAHTIRFDRETLIVRRGNDSSSWNGAAGAWNKAREHWIALLHALGMSRLLDDLCPGKVLRLMAADVAAWHARSRGLHEDTFVWADLPAPWEVVKRRARCTRSMIADACSRHGVDPAGWTGPRPPKVPVPFHPTPELVHGVSISSPGLARILRDSRWFSGRAATAVGAPVTVARDERGFATGAHMKAGSDVN